jgi:hypothetical protein
MLGGPANLDRPVVLIRCSLVNHNGTICTIVGIVKLKILRWAERVAYVKLTRSIYRMFSWENFGDANTSKVKEERG